MTDELTPEGLRPDEPTPLDATEPSEDSPPDAAEQPE
jgi:hypothetical protein